MDQDQNQGMYSLSKLGIDCLKLSRKELMNFNGLKLIKEISMAEAKRLGEFSDKIVFGVEMYTNEKVTTEEKAKIVKNMEKDYSNLAVYVKKYYKKCFEPRMVLLMCEVKMIEAGIIPAKIKETEIISENTEKSKMGS